MTPAELAPYEDAARRYCEMRGVDPDELVPDPHGPQQLIVANPNMVPLRPIWQDVAERLVDLSMLLTAMRQAKEGAH